MPRGGPSKAGRTKKRPRYDDDTKKRALAIYEQQGPHAAAREVGCSAGTVTKWAKAAGVETLRTQNTEAATNARKADNQNRFEAAKERLLEEFERAMDELHAPAMSMKWDDGVLIQQEITEPTFVDKRHIMFRANGAIQYALAIEHRTQGDDDTSQAAVTEWMASIRDEAKRRKL